MKFMNEKLSGTGESRKLKVLMLLDDCKVQVELNNKKYIRKVKERTIKINNREYRV